jgi:hypothetical protein
MSMRCGRSEQAARAHDAYVGLQDSAPSDVDVLGDNPLTIT